MYFVYKSYTLCAFFFASILLFTIIYISMVYTLFIAIILPISILHQYHLLFQYYKIIIFFDINNIFSNKKKRDTPFLVHLVFFLCRKFYPAKPPSSPDVPPPSVLPPVSGSVGESAPPVFAEEAAALSTLRLMPFISVAKSARDV